MKKNYIAPNVKTVVLRFSTHLLQNSIIGITGIGNRTLNTGGTTEDADSRSDRFWEDDEEEDW